MHDATTEPRIAWSIELPHDPVAVPIARALVRTALGETCCPDADADTTDAAELLTSEVVANAVVHTDGADPIRLTVAPVPEGFRIEVHDDDPRPVAGLTHAGLPPSELSETGRGLLLIRAMSSAAGYRKTPAGKAVWFTIPAS